MTNTPSKAVIAFLLALGLTHVSTAKAQTKKRLEQLRHQMVENFVVGFGITNERVNHAMRSVPRHLFVPAKEQRLAYYDIALPIGEGQTISPPFIVASMTAKLDPQPTDRVLEIGTGSGYQAAVMSMLVKEVYSIEIQQPLGLQAGRTLKRLRYKNVKTKIGDGFAGWAEHAPFDKIIVTCSPEKVPTALVQQLREGGKIIIPIGKRYQQMMYLLKKEKGKAVIVEREPTFFVPMTGRAERLRQFTNGDGSPNFVNGDFEQETKKKEPVGWYYVRKAKIATDNTAPSGQRVLHMTNEIRGVAAQALQAFGADGKLHKQLDISLFIRTNEVSVGRSREELPRLEISFFDKRRSSVGRVVMGPWYGTSAWSEQKKRINIPPTAKLAVLTVGMMGGTGEFSIDSLTIKPTKSKR